MSTPETGGTPRGAAKRQALREQRARHETLGWWTKPGVLVFLLVLAMAVAGLLLVVQAGRKIPVREATIDGLALKMDEARWILDQMDHGENFGKPAAMMPGLPEFGKQRVTLDLALDRKSVV